MDCNAALELLQPCIFMLFLVLVLFPFASKRIKELRGDIVFDIAGKLSYQLADLV